MEVLDITNPWHSEQIFPVPWHFVKIEATLQLHYLRKLLKGGTTNREQGKEYLALESGIQLKESKIQYLESEIWNLESRIFMLDS